MVDARDVAAAALLAILVAGCGAGPRTPAHHPGAERTSAPIRISEPHQAQLLKVREFSLVRGVLTEAGEGVHRVEVAIALIEGTRCRWGLEIGAVSLGAEVLEGTGRARTFKDYVLGPRATPCSRPNWSRADLEGNRWTFQLPRAADPLPPGNYRVLARALGTENRGSDGVVFRLA